MKWGFLEPKLGDMIRVKFGGMLYHYGVYISDCEVVQFGLAPNLRPKLADTEIEVCISNMQDFSQGQFVEVAVLDKAEQKKRIPPKKSVEIAKSRLGEKGYQILYNNCEHFAYECVFGERKCSQADELRAYFRSIPIVNVFIAPIKDCLLDNLYPVERQEQIKNVTNEFLKREKYSAWKLLEYGLARSFGYKIKDLTFTQKNGKWLCDKCYFSISHSGGFVAVAISRDNVGVDIETKLVQDKLKDKILTETELKEYELLEDKSGYISTKWVLKESIFKSLEQKSFIPNEIETSRFSTVEKTIELGGEKILLGVATKTPDSVKIFLDFKY